MLDGSRFDSVAAATPFDERGAGVATLALKGVDVAPWLGYVPKTLPVRLQSALLSADLKLAFEQRPKLSLRVAGSVEIAKLKVADAADGALLDAGSIRIDIEELRPLEGLVKLSRVAVDAPHLLAVRNAGGKVNLLLEGASGSGAAARSPCCRRSPAPRARRARWRLRAPPGVPVQAHRGRPRPRHRPERRAGG